MTAFGHPQRWFGVLWAAAMPLALGGCTGSIDSTASGGGLPGAAPGTAGAGPVAPVAGAGGGLPSPLCEAGSVVPVFHRLNRTEYQNTVNALLGVDLPLKQDLPYDSLVYGFDNNADVSLSATLLQKYLKTTRTAVDAALARDASRNALVPCSLETDPNCARSTLEAFLPRAFRRPVTALEVDEYLSYMTTCSSGALAGIGCALQAALLSPKFLFRSELLGTPEAAACGESVALTSGANGMLSPYALASRLSYFLWSSAPDQTLYELAASGTLNDPSVLAQQAERMLDAPPAGTQLAFVADFPSQWLQLAAVESAAPSPELFPDFDDELRQAMQDESRMYFERLVNEDRSALELIRSDFTLLNQRLAEHYGIERIEGPEMRVVDTSGTPRGGVLTQGSYLTATSSSENTSIVLRAKWVLTNLLCTHLPAPPPGAADSVPPPDPGLGLTNRESLELRTANQPCFGCHSIMNPIGFGLESFGATGADRATDNGKPVDTSGELPGGQTFANTNEMLELLKADPRMPQCVTEKLLTYALGRGMDAVCDSGEIQSLTEQFAADGYRMRQHIIRIVQSDLFRSARSYVDARAPEPEEPPVAGEEP